MTLTHWTDSHGNRVALEILLMHKAYTVCIHENIHECTLSSGRKATTTPNHTSKRQRLTIAVHENVHPVNYMRAE